MAKICFSRSYPNYIINYKATCHLKLPLWYIWFLKAFNYYLFDWSYQQENIWTTYVFHFLLSILFSHIILCISAVSVVISPFAFLILLICILSLFFLMSLAKGLSIFFIFSKNQLLVLLIFAIVFTVSISFIYALIFMISFLLLTLGFLCSSFSSCFMCRVRLFVSFTLKNHKVEINTFWSAESPLKVPSVSSRTLIFPLCPKDITSLPHSLNKLAHTSLK